MAKQKVFQEKAERIIPVSKEAIAVGLNRIKSNQFEVAMGEFESLVNTIAWIYSTDRRFRPYQEVFRRCMYTAGFGAGLAKGLFEREVLKDGNHRDFNAYNDSYLCCDTNCGLYHHISLGESLTLIGEEICGMKLLESGLYYDKMSNFNGGLYKKDER